MQSVNWLVSYSPEILTMFIVISAFIFFTYKNEIIIMYVTPGTIEQILQENRGTLRSSKYQANVRNYQSLAIPTMVSLKS